MENKLIEIMAAVFEVGTEDINESTTPDNLDNWDSLRQLNLVSALEEEFDIEFNDDEIAEMISFKLIRYLLEQKMENK